MPGRNGSGIFYFKPTREMSVSVNILQDNLVNIKMFTILHMANCWGLFESKADILSTADKKAASSCNDSTQVVSAVCQNFKGEVASFVIYIHQILLQMANRKNLKATALGASTSTANARNSVFSKAKPTQPTHPLLRLTKKTFNKFGCSNNIRIFVQPNRSRFTESGQILFACDIKASFLRQFYFGSLGRFGDFQGRLASLCPFLNVNCFSFSNAKP